MSDETPTPIAGAAAEPPAASEVLEARLRETTGLLAVARVVSSTTDLPEALRLIWWERGRRFDAAELASLQIIGEQAGILLNHARLRDALEGRAVQLRALSRVNRVVSSSLDESEVLGTIARAAAEMMGAPFVSFWVADEVTHTVTRRAVSDEAMAE